MIVEIEINSTRYKADLSRPLDISIPLSNDGSPIAYGAAPFNAKPFSSEGFIGSINEGSPVNFYDLSINPHGNGTHTESVLHVDTRGLSINETLKKFHFICQVITIEPQINEAGDLIITAKEVKGRILNNKDINALAIRTIPNEETKKKKNYTKTNPCYLSEEAINCINDEGIEHLLLDLPSVDKEIDGGRLVGHKIFWKTQDTIQKGKTITEMIYIDDEIEDGLYLLNLQIISVEIDASPSKPILYKIFNY